MEGKSCCVRGTYVQGLTEADLWRLDIFEGAEYERVGVRCAVVGGEGVGDDGAGGGGEEEREEEREREVDAETYVWREEGRGALEEGEWDFEEFRRERMGRWVGGGGEEEFEGEFFFFEGVFCWWWCVSEWGLLRVIFADVVFWW